MDTTTLKIIIDGRRAYEDAQKLEGSLYGVERAGDKAAAGSKRTGGAFKALAANAFSLKGALAGLGLTTAIKQATQYTDTWMQVNNQLRQVTKSETDMAATRGRLLAISRSTNSEISGTVKLYSELYRSTRDLEISETRVADVTKTINNLFKAGGKPASETAGAVRQLAQGLAAGALRGDEFNSVAEGAPRIMDALAASLNMTRGELREFAATGGITAKIMIDSLEAYREQAQAMADMTDETFGQKMVNAKTNVTQLAGETNSLNDAVGALGDGIVGLSENLDVVVDVGTAFALTYGTKVVTASGMATASLIANTAAQRASIASTLAASEAEVAHIATLRAKAGSLALAGVSTEAYAAANTRLAVAQKAAAASSGLLTAAIGGPAGVAAVVALAGFGIYKWAEGLTSANRHGVDAEGINKRLASSYSDIADQLERLGKIGDATVTGQDLRTAASIQQLEKQKAQLERDLTALKGSGTGLHEREINKRIGITTELLRKVNIELNGLTNPAKKAEKSVDEVGISFAELEAKINGQIAAYRKGEAAVSAWERAQAIANETSRLAKGNLKGETEAISALVTARYDAIDAYDAQQEAKAEAERKAQLTADELQRIKDQIQADLERDVSDFTISIGLDLDKNAIKALAKEFEGLDKIGKAFDGIGEQGEAAIGHIIDATKAFEAASLASTDEAFGAYAAGTASALSAVQQFSDQGSDEFQKLGVIIQALQVAQGISAVLNTAATAPFPANFAAMAAMAASVASLGVSIGGAFGGGGDAGYDLEAVQANQGTGSVLGDATAKSESIANAIEAMEKNSDIEVGTSAKMLRELQDLNMNISGLGTLLARQFGDFTLNDPNVTGFNKGNLFSDANSSFQGALSKVIDAGGIFDLFGIGGMLNDLAGDILGSVLDGLFGKTTASVVDSGIAIQSQNLGELMADGITGASLDALQFATVQIKKKTWFSSSTSYQRQTQELGDNVERQLGLVVGGLYNSVLTGAEAAFGIDASSALAGVNLDAIDISLRGLSGDERTEALAAVFGKMGDQMAAVVPRVDEFQQAGEGLFETLTRVASDVVRAEYQLEQFGLTVGDVYSVAGQADVALELIRDALVANAGAAAGLIDNFAGAEDELLEFADRIFDLQTTFGLMGLNVDALTESMIRGARGSENLASGVEAYISGFLTDGEQLGIKRGQLTAELAQSGIDLPATREAYRSMLEGLDTTTSEGQRLAGALFASAEAADGLYSSIEDAAQAQVDAQLEVVASLRGLVSSAQSIYSPSNLSQLQQSFFATANNARSGDLGSAEALVGIGQSVLSAASNEARSKYEYERIAATVAGTANSIANMFDIPTEVDLLTQQLSVLEEIRDASIQDPSIPEVMPSLLGPVAVMPQQGGERISTLETKLDQVAAELRSGFFAVAKNTQKTAKLLDRWDGDGMPEERVA